MAVLMYSLTEVLVAIGNSYWRCVACQMHFSRQASIDEHVMLKHRESSPHFNSGTEILNNDCSNSSRLSILRSNCHKKIVSDCQVSHTVNFTSCSEPQIVKIDLESCFNVPHGLDSQRRHGKDTIKTSFTHYPEHNTVNNNENVPNNIGPILHNDVQIDQESSFELQKDSDIVNCNDKDDSNGNKSLLSSVLCLLERGMEMDDISGVIHSWDSLNPDLFEQQLLNNTAELSPLSSPSNDPDVDALDTTDELLNKAVDSFDVGSVFLHPLASTSMLQSLPVEETNLFEKCVADDQQEKDIVCNDQLEYAGAERDNSLSCYYGEVGNGDASPESSDYDEDQDENEEEIIQNAVEMFKKYFQFSATKYKTLDLGHETDGSKSETCASSYSQDNIQSLCAERQSRDLIMTLACEEGVDLKADSKKVNSSTISPLGLGSCAGNSVTDTYSSTFIGETLPLASDLPAGELKLSNPAAQSLAKMCLTKTSSDDPSLDVPQFVIKSSPSPLTCVKSHALTCSSNNVIPSHSANSFDKRLDTNGIKTYASSKTNVISERSVSNMMANESQKKGLKKQNILERAKQSLLTCRSIKVGIHQTIPYSGSQAAYKRPNSSCTTDSENCEASENKKMCKQNITRNTSDFRLNTSCLLQAEVAEEHNSLQPHTAEGQVDSFVHDQSAGAYEIGKHFATENFPKQYSVVRTCEESLENFSKQHSVIQICEENQENVMTGANQTLTQDGKKSFSAECVAKATKQCSVCDMRFTTNKALQRHVQTNAMFKDVCRCKVCSRKFHCLHQLNIHIYKFHQVRGKPKCLTCNLQCSNLHCLAQHVWKHTQDKHGASMTLQTSAVASPTSPAKGKAWKCATCGFICLNQAHIRAAHKCKGHSNKCKKCDKRFPTRSSFNLHMASHTNRMHECDLCGQHFKTRTSCHCHRLSHGTNQRGYLSQQVKIHSKDKKECPTYLCSECDKSYKMKKHLQRHVDVVHRGIKDYRFKCEYCHQQFFSAWQLRDHITWHHFKEKPYHCQYCGKGFVCRPTLTRHQRKDHTGIKPHKCHYCDEAFIDKKNLDTHEVKVHLGVYPLSCLECGKGFIHGSALRSHLSLHSNQRPHQCHVCGSCFTKNNHLKRHTKICLKRNVSEPRSLDLQSLPVLQPHPPSGLTQYLLPQTSNVNVLQFPGTLHEHSN